MRTYVVDADSLRRRTRLNLAPRLRADETLSSWLERLAGAYAMTPVDLLRWLGYPSRTPDTGVARLDLDIHPPPDLAALLESTCGTRAQEIDAHRLPEYGTLPPTYRTAFCPHCWAEDGPYRRREWANGWSMICIRHRQLLSERVRTTSRLEQGDELSWLAFYESPGQWRTSQCPWEGEMWQELCVAFQLEPKVEFFRLRRWLAELYSLGTLARRFPGISSANAIDPCCGDLRVKRDLTLYALIHFPHRSLLKFLVPTVNEFQLIQAELSADLCMRTAPDVDLKNRLMACIVSRHLWERLTEGIRWCMRGIDLDEYVGALRRTSIEEWWLEGRIRGWPPQRATTARELFQRKEPRLATSRWSHCHQSCLPKSRRGYSGGPYFCLPENWQCQIDRPRARLLEEQYALEHENLVFSRLRKASHIEQSSQHSLTSTTTRKPLGRHCDLGGSDGD